MTDRTPTVGVRVPLPMWTAYERVCARLGRDRTEDLLERMREQIREHGDETDLADLARAEAELAERRARKGGRPPKRRDGGAMVADGGEPAGIKRDE